MRLKILQREECTEYFVCTELKRRQQKGVLGEQDTTKHPAFPVDPRRIFKFKPAPKPGWRPRLRRRGPEAVRRTQTQIRCWDTAQTQIRFESLRLSPVLPVPVALTQCPYGATVLLVAACDRARQRLSHAATVTPVH